MSSTVLQPIQQTINLNYSLDMRLKEREDMALDIENAKRKGEEVAQMEVRKKCWEVPPGAVGHV
jgi:hypothetical protein